MDKILFQEQREDYRNECGVLIEGIVPDWLHSGVFFRNGPGLFQVGKTNLNHFFDGYAKIQWFHFSTDSKINYSSKFLDTDAYTKAIRHKAPFYSEFGTLIRPRNPFLWVLSRFHPYIHGFSDNSNIAAVDFNDFIYVVSEGLTMFRMDLTSELVSPQTIKKVNLKSTKECKNFIVTCAHWQVDRSYQSAEEIRKGSGLEESSKMYGFAINKSIGFRSLFQKTDQTLFYLDKLERPTILAKIPMKGHRFINYNHSFSVTPSFVIFIRQPIAFDVLRMMRTTFFGRSRNFADCLVMERNTFATIIIISKTSGKILARVSTEEPLFTLHHINAYEDSENKNVILDCVCFTSLSFMNVFFRENLKTYNSSQTILPARVKRFTVSMNKDCDKTYGVNISSADVEFPCINEFFYGKKYNYMWCVCQPSDEATRAKVQSYAIGRINVTKTDSNLEYWYEDGSWPSEPCFVPRNLSPNVEFDKNLAETDGVVMATILCNTGFSYLLILDGETMTSLAKVTWPNVTPGLLIGIHSLFVFPREERSEQNPRHVAKNDMTVSAKLSKYETTAF